MFWPFRSIARRFQPSQRRTKIIVEIPDALDPMAADRKYVEPLRQLLTDANVGAVADVAQGTPNTADECTRFITLEVTQFESAWDIVGQFLVESAAPPGTLTTVCDEKGKVVDSYLLMPETN
jgi:hypothetical protein